MPISLEELAAGIVPKRTVLLFGAGSSLPSGAPSVTKLSEHFITKFSLPADGFKLSELATLAEKKSSRLAVITELRKFFVSLTPSGGLRHIPLYDWKSIYTTNYDKLVEDAYKAHNKTCRSFSSNFDFVLEEHEPDCVLFKLHGTIDKDECDGHRSRIILTDSDFDQTEAYREQLYDRLKGDLAGADLVVIGHSLSDPDMDAIVKRAIKINTSVLSPSRLTLLLYTKDENRASLVETKGLKVAFGGIDDFFSALASRTSKASPPAPTTDDPYKANPVLSASSVEIADVADVSNAAVSAMFNGWPASYADIDAGLTFERNVAKDIADHFEQDSVLCAILVGAAGVGKSTAARQAIQMMRKSSIRCWEHKVDHTLDVDGWKKVASYLKENGFVGALFVDDAHIHLHSLNELVDRLVSDDNAHLKIVISSTKNHWYPRIKTPNIYRFGKEFKLSRLTPDEIERLLNLIERSADVRALVEDSFSGFNRQERRRRLVDRCEADMFVCLKNIFASGSFDDIILREYAGLADDDQQIYRHVAAMETAGVRVHRQLVIRLLGIAADSVPAVLKNLDDIVDEYTVDSRFGIYGWRCRHPVISAIVTKFKFKDLEQTIQLFDRVIDCISPTYDIEIRTIRELCNLQGGLARIPDRNIQNRLLRKMISNAPGERVPRHRLIRNLIEQGAFEKAETEIRVFNKDFGSDGPVHRYKIRLMIERAKQTPGILEEDRIAILEQAQELAVFGIERYENNKNILSAYADLGIEYYRRTGKYTFFDDAIAHMKAAEDRLADPELTTLISRYERRIANHAYEPEEASEEAIG